MRFLLPTLILATGGHASAQPQASTQPPVQVRLSYGPYEGVAQVPAVQRDEATLSDPALSFVSVGPQSVRVPTAERGRDIIEDITLRQFNLATNAGAEQMDNWWSGPGADLIAIPVPATVFPD